MFNLFSQEKKNGDAVTMIKPHDLAPAFAHNLFTSYFFAYSQTLLFVWRSFAVRDYFIYNRVCAQNQYIYCRRGNFDGVRKK